MLDRIRGFLFEHRSARQVVAKNFIWLSMGEVVSRLLRSLIILYAARVLGAEGYGVFSYALGLAGFFTIFSAMGIDNVLTRGAVQNPELRSRYFSTAFLLKSVLTIFTVFLILFIAPSISKIEAAKNIIPLAGLLVVFDGARNFISAFFRARERMEMEALMTAVTNLGITLLGFIILLHKPTPFYLAVSYVGGAAIGAALGFFILRKEFFSLFDHFDASLVPRIISAAWPLALATVFSIFLTYTDILMLGFWHNAAVVGIYSAPLRVIQLLQVLPTLFAVSVFPYLSRIKTEGSHADSLRPMIERSLVLLFAFGIPLTAGGAVLARPLMTFLFGPEYSAGSLIFQILIFGPIFLFPGTLLTNLVFARDKHAKLSWYTGATALVNIFLNILLIPRYGGAGSAIATQIAQFTYLFLVWRLARTTVQFSVFSRLHKILFSSLAMGCFALLLSLSGIHVLLTISFSALLYALLLFFLKEPSLFQIFEIARRGFRR